jgi:hypothetical protein
MEVHYREVSQTDKRKEESIAFGNVRNISLEDEP